MNKGLIQVDGKFYKKCKVILSPVKYNGKVTPFIDLIGDGDIREWKPPFHALTYSIYYHLYILSDEEIKEVDWVLEKNPDNSIVGFKPKKVDSVILKAHKKHKGYAKIIASTNPELTRASDKLEIMRMNTWNISNNIPRPSDAFLKAYCEQGGINEVLVEYESYHGIDTSCEEIRQVREEGSWDRKLVDFKLKISPDNTITIKPVKSSWNREEVIELCRKAFKATYGTGKYGFDKWIEENL